MKEPASYIIKGQISEQMVMNKIREASPRQKPIAYRVVEDLHIDADENHVSLQDGGDTIVPLDSVYEEIKRREKRSICKNVFHISEYGKSLSTLWTRSATRSSDGMICKRPGSICTATVWPGSKQALKSSRIVNMF